MNAPVIDCYLLRLEDAVPDSENRMPGAFEEAGQDGTVRVHRARLDGAARRGEAWEVLSEEEKARVAAMRHPGLASARLFAHASLRLLLARRLARPAATLSFETGAHGKPRLAGGGPHFSLSWRAGVAALAIADAYPVGIDAETDATLADTAAVADWLFPAGETAAIAAAEEERRQAMFLIAWTRKEAVCKAAGVPLDTMRGIETRHSPVTLGGEAYAVHSQTEACFTWSLAWEASSEPAAEPQPPPR